MRKQQLERWVKGDRAERCRTTKAEAPQTPHPLKRASPHSSGNRHLSFVRRGRRGCLSPRNTRGCDVRSRERAWAPTAASPDPASALRWSLFHRWNVHRTRRHDPAVFPASPSPPLAPHCTPPSVGAARRDWGCGRRRDPTPRGGRGRARRPSWRRPRAGRRWGGLPWCVLPEVKPEAVKSRCFLYSRRRRESEVRRCTLSTTHFAPRFHFGTARAPPSVDVDDVFRLNVEVCLEAPRGVECRGGCTSSPSGAHLLPLNPRCRQKKLRVVVVANHHRYVFDSTAPTPTSQSASEPTTRAVAPRAGLERRGGRVSASHEGLEGGARGHLLERCVLCGAGSASFTR